MASELEELQEAQHRASIKNAVLYAVVILALAATAYTLNRQRGTDDRVDRITERIVRVESPSDATLKRDIARALRLCSRDPGCKRGFQTAALRGPRGRDGDTGAQGPVGPTGATGSSGARGSSGATGGTGARGQGGSRGGTGQRGSTGSPGPGGPSGGTGPQGPTGPQGDPAPGIGNGNGNNGNGGGNGGKPNLDVPGLLPGPEKGKK